jgi:DNA-binding XRE family transcriptional regulator
LGLFLDHHTGARGGETTAMAQDWSRLVRRYRIRHGVTQMHLAALVGVSQRTISRWERGEDRPSLEQQRLLRDLAWEPTAPMLRSLAGSISHCPAPRALSRTRSICLQAVSQPALVKRPSVIEWIGRDLAPIACGVLAEMLEDKPLQRAVATRQIAYVVATSGSVLQTVEHARIGKFHTTITYFFHEGTLYSDAISVPARADVPLGYRAVPMDGLIGD